MFFKGTTLQGMVEEGRRELAGSAYDSWALAYEGYVTVAHHRESAIMLESWSRGAAGPTVLAQVWVRSSDRKHFTLSGPPLRLPGSAAPTAGKPLLGVPVALTEREKKAFAAGVAQQKEMKSKGFLGRQDAESESESYRAAKAASSNFAWR